MDRRIRVLCVDDSSDVASACSMLVDGDARLQCIGVRASAHGIVEEVERSRPDVLLMDLTMPGPAPLQAIRALAGSSPWCRVIAYSGFIDEPIRIAALRAGAAGVVSKLDDLGVLMNEIHRVASEPVAATP